MKLTLRLRALRSKLLTLPGQIIGETPSGLLFGSSIRVLTHSRPANLIPFWKKIVPNLKFVICIRSPLEVAKSLAVRDGFTIEKGIYLWNRYLRAAIRNTEGGPRIFTFYEDYFKDAIRDLDPLVGFCGLQKPDDLSFLEQVISRKLKHHAYETLELLGGDGIAAEYKLFYIGLRALFFDGFTISKVDQWTQDSENINRSFQLFEDFHNENIMTQLETLISEKDHRLSQALLVEKRQVNECQSAVIQKEEQVSQLQTVIAQKEQQVDQFMVVVAQREQQVEELTTEIVKNEQQIVQLNAIVTEKEDKVRSLQAEKRNLEIEITQLQRQMKVVLSSKTWKLSAPLRWIHSRLSPFWRWLKGLWQKRKLR